MLAIGDPEMMVRSQGYECRKSYVYVLSATIESSISARLPRGTGRNYPSSAAGAATNSLVRPNIYPMLTTDHGFYDRHTQDSLRHPVTHNNAIDLSDAGGSS